MLAEKLEAAERRASEADARAVQTVAKVEVTASELLNVNAAAQINQGRFESIVRELDAAKNATVTATIAAEKAIETAAELRDQVEVLKSQAIVERTASKSEKTKIKPDWPPSSWSNRLLSDGWPPFFQFNVLSLGFWYVQSGLSPPNKPSKMASRCSDIRLKKLASRTSCSASKTALCS